MDCLPVPWLHTVGEPKISTTVFLCIPGHLFPGSATSIVQSSPWKMWVWHYHWGLNVTSCSRSDCWKKDLRASMKTSVSAEGCNGLKLQALLGTKNTKIWGCLMQLPSSWWRKASFSKAAALFVSLCLSMLFAEDLCFAPLRSKPER